MMRDFNSTMKKSLTVPVFVNDKYRAMNDTANHLFKQNLKLKSKILKFKVPQGMIRKFPSIQQICGVV
jgi:hypothetical protein